jgi:hypothetical protein
MLTERLTAFDKSLLHEVPTDGHTTPNRLFAAVTFEARSVSLSPTVW